MSSVDKVQTWGRRVAGVISIATLAVVAQAASPELAKVVVADASTTTAQNVMQAKQKANSGERVAVQGKVKDFVDGQAVFTIMDLSMKSCRDNGENCPTPWDYCCYQKSDISKGAATVKIVGAAGGKQAIKSDVKGVNGVDHLVIVTAEGVAQKDKAGNLTVLADKVHVKK